MNNGTSKSYKFTRDNNFLNETERDFYEENGFLVKKNLVDHRILDECRKHFIDIAENRVPKGKWVVMAKDVYLRAKNVQGEHVINKIQFLSYDDVFYKYLSYGPMIDIIQSVIGPNISTFQSMVINKPPDTHVDISTHPVHQDLNYFQLQPANSIVASWTAMEKVDVNNGCLYVYPGTHKGKLYSHDYPGNEKKQMYHEIVEYEKLLNGSSKVNLSMEKGDTVFFHPLLFHGSGPNVTKGFRKAITAHYIDSGGHFAEVKGTIREKVTDEMMNAFKKCGYPVDYKKFWRLKIRLVRGEPGIFQHEFLE